MIVAIDGPAGSGKSTVAKAVATRLGMHYLDTGAMYRAVALAAIDREVSLEDEEALGHLARSIDVVFEHESASPLPTAVIADGADVTAAIRTPRVDAAVSAAARVPAVREAMVAKQRALADAGDLVAEGRDIGTVVFPDARTKIFLTATPEERARRRHAELHERGESLDEGSVLEAMVARDGADSSRDVGPLAVADDAIQLDTTGLSIDEVVERIATLVGGA